MIKGNLKKSIVSDCISDLSCVVVDMVFYFYAKLKNNFIFFLVFLNYSNCRISYSLYIIELECHIRRLLVSLFDHDLIEMFFTEGIHNFQNPPFHCVFICNIEGGDLYQN